MCPLRPKELERMTTMQSNDHIQALVRRWRQDGDLILRQVFDLDRIAKKRAKLR